MTKEYTETNPTSVAVETEVAKRKVRALRRFADRFMTPPGEISPALQERIAKYKLAKAGRSVR